MGLMATGSTCDPNRDYTYTEVLEHAARIDIDMLEDMAYNGTPQTKKNLLKVLEFYGRYDDARWESAYEIKLILSGEDQHSDD